MSDFEKLQETVYQLLELVGENPDREGLLDTPKRVAKMYQEVFSGLGRDPKDEFTAVFSEGHEEVVLVKDIPFHSMCAHHLLPAQIATALDEALSPEGVFVMVEAEHMCMTMRGIKKPGSKTVTTVAKGIYKENVHQRQEILSMIHHD